MIYAGLHPSGQARDGASNCRRAGGFFPPTAVVPTMTSEDPRDVLERVGARFDFTEYEAEAYLAVLEHGRVTAAELADLTSIPQPRVYDTVRSLADRNLVDLHESRPMEVVAIDPREAFADVRTSLDDLEDALERAYAAPAPGGEAVTLVKSRSTIVRNLRDTVEAADYELLLSLTPDLLAAFEDEIREARARGVAIDLLLSPAAEVPDPEDYDYAAVATTARARRGVTTPVVAVADGRHSVYATREALRANQDRYGVVFNRSELGFLVTGFLLTAVWSSAESLVEDAVRRPFPRRYATVRRCITELAAAEGEFYAAIRGRDVVTGDSRTVRGRVADRSVGTAHETAALVLDTEDGRVEVGGQAAALEDVEAHEIVVDRGSVPSLDE